MKKINIIKHAQEFEKIIKYRHHYNNHFFVIYIMPKQNKYYRFGISIPKKVGNSVTRNKIKRQLKSMLDSNIGFNKNFDYVIIIRKDIIDLNYDNKKQNLISLLSKIDGEWKNEKK